MANAIASAFPLPLKAAAFTFKNLIEKRKSEELLKFYLKKIMYNLKITKYRVQLRFSSFEQDSSKMDSSGLCYFA